MVHRFLDYLSVERQYSELTVSAYGDDLRHFADFLGVEVDDLDLNTLSSADVQSWMIEMLDRGQSPRSVKRRLSSLRSYAKYCLRVGLTTSDITQKVIAPKMQKPLPVFYKESEMKAEHVMLEHADDFLSKRNALIIEMLYQTGMRRAELLRLTDADVDLNQMQVRVFGKRRKERIVPFGKGLSQLIEDYMSMRHEQTGLAQTLTFFCSPDGSPMKAAQVYEVVKRMMSEVSTLKKQSPHVLRHTFATTMLNNGADINTIKTLMGHASLAATEVYTHTTFEQIQREYTNAHPRQRKT